MRVASRVPLRVRMALAFALATAVALGALGVFLHLRVAATLDEQTRVSLTARIDSLSRLPGGQRDAAVRDLSGESFAQVLDAHGNLLASSPQLRGPLLGRGQIPAPGGSATREVNVFLAGEDEVAPVLLMAVRPSSDVVVVGTSTEDVEEVLEGLRAQLILGGALALLIATGLGYLVAGAALRPMERMRRHAATISARSSGERLPLPDVWDEVHRLGRTLNDMLDRLDVGLRRERQFVAEASHELRTPLALLRTELDLAGSRSRSPKELSTFLASATEEVDRLSVLVDRLLVLAKADDARLELDVAPMVVNELLEEVARRFGRLTEGRRISVSAAEKVEVPADWRRLDQAVSNLVDNAVRHGRGDVELRVTREPGHVLITVSDQGDVQLGEELFNRFRRGDGPRAGGRGLGLSLVRAIVTEHGGTVRFDDAASGPSVVIELPASPRPDTAKA